MTVNQKQKNKSFIDEILINDFGRLRSGWRFGMFLVPFMILFPAFATVISYILINLPIGYGDNTLLARIVGSLIGLFLAIAIGWLCGKLLEDLPFRALGVWFTKFWLKDLIIGILIGAGSIAFAVLIAMAFGNLSFEYNESAGSTAILITLATSLVIFAFGAAFEEVLVRGYIFQTFTRARLAWLAILITSLFFAVGHLGNPSSNYFSSINTAIAGVWLGVAYLKTRTLWLATGIHFAWNWVQGAFFGIEVSGLTDLTTAPVLKEIDTATSMISGGSYGIEGGIACTISLIASTALIWFLPTLKPTDEMMDLTNKEIPINENLTENI